MSKRTQELLLRDIIESAEKVINYTNNITFEEFALSSIIIDAVIRNIEIIGEAANRLPDEFKDNYPQINWHKIRGLRNRVVHDYFGIDHSIIWSVKENYLPELIREISVLL